MTRSWGAKSFYSMTGTLYLLLPLFLVFLMVSCSDSESQNPSDGDTDFENLAAGDIETEEEAARYDWPTCDSIQSSETLAEKAAAFDKVARERHIAPDGLFRNLYLTEDLNDVEVWHHTPNTILWSGIYLASQALRYRVTGDQEAQENAKRIVAGLHDLTAVTGKSGLYGRSMYKPDASLSPVSENATDWADSTVPGYEGWKFNFDVSQDGYAGLMFGYGVALEHFDDEQLLSDIKDRVDEVVHHLVSNGLQIIDITGEVTEHGRLFHSALDNYPGFNAMLASSWVKTGQTALDDPDLDDFYYGCMMQMRDGVDCPDIEDESAVAAFNITSYIDSMENYLYLLLPGCKHNIDNFDMCYQAIYPLLQKEKDPELKKRLVNVVRNNMLYNDDPDNVDITKTGNTFFIFAYAALTGDGPDDPILKEAVDKAICTLKEFPSEKFQRHILAGEQEHACTNRLNHPNAAEPIPLSEYAFDNYLWRLDFYEIVRDEVPKDRRMIFSPEDYLMAYWLGRYHGLITQDM